ncbi:MAG: nucleoside triphosphate pyrophosphohydrolase [Thermodesulfobacteriota bacterium]|nr:nucleoside triphosphate pyrophosphohydrolase [Thermodesulfobacteriota bacterium]
MEAFDRLVAIIARLRAPGGCPWDAEQTHQSISPGMVEEVFEAVEAIEDNDMEHLKEELGDVLLHVVFHSVIAVEDNDFTIEEVINSISDKLVYRHPHVFAGVTVEDSAEVKKNWEILKQQEKGKEDRVSLLDGIPKALPALLYARKIQAKAARIGFDWPDPKGAIEKVREEADELLTEIENNDHHAMEDEIGDLLFSIVNVARFCRVDPETALRGTNTKFKQRFARIEAEAKARNITLEDMTLEDMDAVWEKAKE